MSVPRALIIDDEQDICELIKISLSNFDLDVDSVHTYREAVEHIHNQTYQLCLTDMRLPDGDGLDLLKEIQKTQPQLPVAVITAHGTMDSAIVALKRGAFDFVSKPIDLQILRDMAATALSLSEHQHESCLDDLLGQSQAMLDLKKQMHKISRSQAPVAIQGPSGSGKEMVARIIHQLSARSDNPFIAVNCGAIPNELMESEFFGHVKGSFTGAHSNKDGLFKAAHRGTLFLDEVGDLPIDMQVKLLRAIQERAIRPVGCATETTVDVRVLSATHKNLYDMVHQGQFREDLYYRLNVIEVNVPSLEDRQEDIPLLAQHLLHQLSQEQGLNAQLSEQAIEALRAYSFPGNIRELENILERALALCENQKIDASDLNLPIHEKGRPSTPHDLEAYLDDVEKKALLNALERSNGNKTQAAKLLGISFRALRYRLKKLGLE